MTQVSSIQSPQYPLKIRNVTVQPSYNAVKIDIHNPQVNAPGCAQNPITEPNYTSQVYDYPKAPIYDIPKQSVYGPKPEVTAETKPETKVEVTPAAVKEVPTIPPPVIVQTPAPVQAVTPVASKKDDTKTTAEKPAEAKKIEVKTPEAISPSVDINGFISKLNNPDYEVQAKTLASIAEMAQVSPVQASELLDVRVVDTLLGLMNKDTSKLEGPSAKQIQLRADITSGKKVSDADLAEANKITPMEQAERNKQFAIYTVATLEKLYSSEIEKLSKNVVPLTELPGAAGIVEQIKNNANPMVRASGIDALSYLQRPEYKTDLTTIFTVAKNDKDANVQNAASKALAKLATIASIQAAAQTPAQAPAQPVKTEQAVQAAKIAQTKA